VEVQKLTLTTSTSIITVLKSLFTRHGVPITLVTDNGPQFVSQEMSEFSLTYGFNHVTSSPHYLQSNGLAEHTVKTVKQLLSKSPDLFLGLLTYRATSLPWCGLSPAELLVGCRIRTDAPQHPKIFKPQWPYLDEFKEPRKRTMMSSITDNIVIMMQLYHVIVIIMLGINICRPI